MNRRSVPCRGYAPRPELSSRPPSARKVASNAVRERGPVLVHIGVEPLSGVQRQRLTGWNRNPRYCGRELFFDPGRPKNPRFNLLADLSGEPVLDLSGYDGRGWDDLLVF